MTPVKTLIIIEDDQSECRILSDAVRKAELKVDVQCVKDAATLWDYLSRQGRFSDEKTYPSPSLIFFDLDCGPGGYDVLKKIKSDARFKLIPVIALTSKKELSQYPDLYGSGINSFIEKPESAESFAPSLKVIYKYWFENVELPTIR